MIREHEAAATDRELNAMLHHVLLANRFWMLGSAIREYAGAGSRWLAAASEADFARILRDPLIPGGQCSVAEALLQVCMHSHGHRAQVATRLRQHGAVPPPTDFINWLTSRPAAAWPLSVTPPGA